MTFADDFKREVDVLDTAKCLLANEGSLSDYLCPSGYVSVSGAGDRYLLYLDELEFDVFVKDRMILDYSIR